MAVEIKHNGKKNKLDLFYHLVKDEDLKMSTPTHYHFPSETDSLIKFSKKEYVPKNIFIAPKLHLADTIQSELELVLEAVNNEKNTKIFLCIGLNFVTDMKNKEWVFPLKTPSLEHLFSQCLKNHVYQTKSKNIVIVCSKSISVNGVKPKMTMSSKTAYKDIIDNDSYNVLSLVETSKDNGVKEVPTKSSNVRFEKMLFHKKSVEEQSIEEGFKSGTYMECKLLQEDATDHNQVYEDVAVVPLSTNTYERGMVTFSHFLHFFLVTFGAGVGFPHLFLNLFSSGDFKDNAGNTNFFRTIIGYSSFILFFLVGLIMLLIGLLDPRYKQLKQNEQEIKQGSVLATVGFYFILIHCSFALGMFAMKKFEYSDFKTMFRNDNLNGSFFDIMDGLM